MYLSSVLGMDNAKPAIVVIESLEFSSTLPCNTSDVEEGNTKYPASPTIRTNTMIIPYLSGTARLCVQTRGFKIQ